MPIALLHLVKMEKRGLDRSSVLAWGVGEVMLKVLGSESWLRIDTWVLKSKALKNLREEELIVAFRLAGYCKQMVLWAGKAPGEDQACNLVYWLIVKCQDDLI